MKRWIRKMFQTPPRTVVRSNPLSILALEDRIVPADFRDVGGLRFFTDGVYDDLATISRTSSLVQIGLTPGVGEAFTPLFDAPDGVSVRPISLFARINSTLSVGGLTFTGSNLDFTFDTPNQKFSLSGDASFSFNGVTITSSFGTPTSATPGLVIQNGELASIDVGITSAFTVANVDFETQDLRLKFDTTAGNRYVISGQATATVQGTSPISLTTQFGESAEEPGLVIVDGRLDQFAVGVSSTFSVGGLALEAKDLTFALNTANSSYNFFGSASAKFGNNAESVGFDLLLGDSAQPGVSIVNGRLVSLNAGVTSDFNIAGVSINTRALTVTLDVPSNTFTMSGSAGFAFNGVGTKSVNLDVQLGESITQPGIKIVNGTLTELSVGVTGGFNIAGLSAEARSLTFTYNRALNRYGFSGGATLSTAPDVTGKRVLDRFGVQIGSLAQPGILVQNGRLEQLDIALNGRINLGSLSVNPRNLRVQFTRVTGVLQFTGGLSVSLASKFNASADLINGGLTINTDTGAVRLNGLRLGMTDTRLGSVVIRSAFIQFTQDSSDIVSLFGGANVELPAGVTVDGSFDIVNGRLRRINLSLSKDPGVQIPGTPIFVSRVAGELKNLDTPDQLIVTGSMTFTAGPSYRISGKSVSLLQGKVTLSLNLSGTIVVPGFLSVQPFGPGSGFIQLSGVMTLLGDAIPVSSGQVTIGFNRTTGEFLGVQANAKVRLYGGFVVGTINLNLNATSGDTTIKAGLAIVFPDFTIPEVRTPPDFIIPDRLVIPATNIGGLELAAVDVTIRLFANHPLDSSLTFEARVLNGFVTGTVTVTFRGDLTYSGKAGIIPFGPATKKLPALFEDTSPATEAPTLRILSTERVIGSTTRDLIVNFEATPGSSTLDQAFVKFNVNGSPRADEFSLGSLATRRPTSRPFAGFNPTTGIGFITITNPDRDLPLLTPLSLVGTISQNLVNGLTTVTQPFGPINGVAPLPTLVIQSAERVPNSPTNDLKVTYRLTSAAVNTVTVGFKVDPSPDFDVGSLVRINILDASQTFDVATGIGTTIIRNPDALAVPGRTFTISGQIQDNFGARDTIAFGPIAQVIGPPTITVAPTIPVATIGGPVGVPVNSIVLSDPAALIDPNARLRVSFRTDSSISMEVLSFLRPASIVIEQNRSSTLIMSGTAIDLNTMLNRLLITRLSDNDAHSVSVFVNRVGVVGGTVQANFTISQNVVLGVTIPSTAPSIVNAFGPGVNVLAGSTIQLLPNTSVRRIGIKLVNGSGTNARPPFPGDQLSSDVPATSPVFAFFDPSSFELVIAGDGTESLADLEQAIQATTYQTTGSSGRINIRITITDSRRQVVSQEKTIVVQNTGPAAAPRVARASLGSSSNSLFVDVGPTRSVFTGTGPAIIAPELNVSNLTPADPILSATVRLTGLFDATSDQLAFTPAGNITGNFDATTGILTLSGDATTPVEDFKAVLNSVSFNSIRKNPTPYPREVLFTVTSASGATSADIFGLTSIAIEVPTVPPGISATTTNLAFPPNADPLAVFPDLELVYPDEALPPPSVPLGTFIPGSTITRATVSISTNYVPGEDFLTFTPVGDITGSFDADTGELLLDGTGTLAEYKQVARSVMYQNRNTSPSTADRLIMLVLDDGSSSGNPPTLSRVIQPQSDGLDTIRTSGSLTPLVIPPTTKEASLGLTDLTYAPRPGETVLVYTITSAPQDTRGTVVLTDGTIAVTGMEVPIEQLRGAKFVASNTPRSGTVPFTFTIAGINPVTGEPTQTPLTATVPIEITNVAPVAGDDQYTIDSDTPVILGFLGNDTDVNGDLFLVESFTQPANGVVTQDPLEGTFTYTPNAGFAGDDTFTYTLTDGAGGNSTATVTMTVVGPNVPPPPPPKDLTLLLGAKEFAAGADVGNSTVNFYNPDGSLRFAIDPFAGFTGGVRTASADFNGDGLADLVVGTGPGRATRVIVQDGKTQAQIFSIDPFEAAFTGGIYVAAGDLNGDGIADLIITPDEGGGPRARVFSGKGFVQLADFFGIDDTNFRGGARAAIGDINGDGKGDLVIAAGFGGGPRISVYDGSKLGVNGGPNLFGDFFAFEDTLRNGTYVSVGDINGDGLADLVSGAGPGGGPRVSVFNGLDLMTNTQTRISDFFAGDINNRSGVRVSVKNLDSDDLADVVVGAGTGAGFRVTAYAGKAIRTSTPPELFAFDAIDSFSGGVFVG